MVRMALFSSSIPSTISSGSVFLERLRIERCCLRPDDFIARDFGLFSKMIANSGNRATLPKQLKRTKIWYS